ncbi:hypothetical protein ED312_05450 [Sinomicrobium pectinilyticum]|uniref:Uncharacterized protein n=1 Tax=Sinomicrobium pectinilyticum TaxID=1084421 RepID=A0A3N0ES60_SINP1|nr:hypothetical protein [Sinomicrobium pectinilyticum]RNL90622.1 hypothetical protein ED312_05450 [Sinomicrobium pectinilyticum]
MNFFLVIREEEQQRSPVDEGAKSTLPCRLANMAYQTGKILTRITDILSTAEKQKTPEQVTLTGIPPPL